MAAEQQRAAKHYARQAAITAAAVVALRRAFERRLPWPPILALFGAYQLAAATAAVRTMARELGRSTVRPALFAGVSSAGFPLSEPLIATIDKVVPAPPEGLPTAWWDADIAEFWAQVEQLIASEVQDAGRSAAGAVMVELDHQNYVRLINPPSCGRCVVLAGRIYKNLDGFERHPKCRCKHWPVQDWEQAHDQGLVSSPEEAFERGQIRGLSKADAQAIRDGADIAQVINAHRGLYTADVLGRRLKATRMGTTRRAAWRRANPSLLVRLRPESIYRIADGDADLARSLLRTYGYID